nr:putative reverse transcriptase domain-containing protein [Tanacetum cinerariifolium]
MSVIACNDSLNAKTVNVKSVSAMCAKCVMIEKHDLCVPKSVAKPLKKTVASESNKKPTNNVRKLHERFGKIYKWLYIKFTPSGYMWKPKSPTGNVNPNLIEIVLFIVDFGCSKHMMGNLKLLINFVEKFLATVKFRNDQIAPILGYGDLAAPFEALYGRKCHSPVCWTDVGEAQILGPKLIQDTTEKIVQLKQRMQAAHDRQKSYADLKRKPMKSQVGDKVMLKVSPWKGVVRFGKRGKLNPRYVGPFKKCHADEPLAVPLDGLHFDDKLHFVEEPVEIVDREVKRLKQSQILLVK